MTVSMTELMRTVRNCFVSGAACGSWKVAGGVISGDPALRSGWIAIEGLGAFELAGGRASGLPDGAYEGTIWLLDPPADFSRLLGDINAWLAEQEKAAAVREAVPAPSAPAAPPEPVITRRRESFGVYATETDYTLVSAPATAATATPVTAAAPDTRSWEAVFAGRMMPYRRMFPEVNV